MKNKISSLRFFGNRLALHQKSDVVDDEPTTKNVKGRTTRDSIYRDNLSAIIYHRLSLLLKINLIYRLLISLLLYILFSPINYRDKRFFMHACFNFKVSKLALWKNTRCPLGLVVI